MSGELKKYTFKRPAYFDINQIFDCGQCFRFDYGVESGKFAGTAFGKHIEIMQEDDAVTLFGADQNDFDKIWKRYFAADEDYDLIRSDISLRFDNDITIKNAMEKGCGIRILRQEPWEAVCSFIISQNNNIPRIKKIISSLSREFGEKIEYGEDIFYAFPTAEALYEAGESRIFELRTGFRAGYIFDAAKRIRNNELDFEKLSGLPTVELMNELMTVRGIGPKVASCAALFGFGRTDAFPVDVWVKRVLAKYYPGGLDISTLGSYAGIAQQYLFYYERYSDREVVGL